jgi:FHA domain
VTVTRAVVPGDWYGVLGDSVLVLLPPGAKSRVTGIWERVDDGAGFDEVLDALISDGLRELPGFVLVSSDSGDVKVVIRGEGEAELRTADGPVTVVGAADTTWVERNVAGVTGLRVRVGDPTGDGDGTPYTVSTGLVRVAIIEQPAMATVAATPEPVPERPARVLPPDPALAPSPPARVLPPDPALTPPPRDPAPEPAPVTTPSVAPVPIPVAPAPGGPVMEPDDSGDTQAGGFVPSHLAHDEEASPPSVRPVARLIFSSGEAVEVDRPVVVGRSPEARRYGDDAARLVTVPSPQQEISSTHLEIRPGSGADHGSAVATDLGSTNGTVVVQPGLPAEDLQPGIGVALVPGAIVDLGEGVTIQVTGT